MVLVLKFTSLFWLNQPEAEFKDLELGLKFETRLKYGVFHFIFNILRFKLVFGGF